MERNEIYALSATEVNLLCVLVAQRMVELQSVKEMDSNNVEIVNHYSRIYKKFRSS